MVRTQRVESREELERSLDDFITRGYEIKDQGQYSAKVKATDFGDVPIHGFLFLFAFVGGAVTFDAVGVPSGAVWLFALGANVSYAAYSRLTAEEIVIKVDESGTE